MKEYEQSLYHGKHFDGGTILEMIVGYRKVPDEILEAGRKFGHPPDSNTGSYVRAIFQINGKGTYLADLRWTPDAGNEVMIFRSDIDGHTRSGKDLYSARCEHIMVPIFLGHLKKFVEEMTGNG